MAWRTCFFKLALMSKLWCASASYRFQPSTHSDKKIAMQIKLLEIAAILMTLFLSTNGLAHMRD